MATILQSGSVVVLGGTGLVGQALVIALLAQGRSVVVVTRKPRSLEAASSIHYVSWSALPEVLEGASAIINLAGENIGTKRWTAAHKALVRSSRLEAVHRVEAALRSVAQRPPLLIQASAIGYYGARDGDPIDEQAPAGSGFLSDLVRDWESASEGLGTAGMRVVKIRFGMVLSRSGGALPALLRPLRLGLGTTFGSGTQGMSWIHIQDAVGLMVWILGDPTLHGIINATAPEALAHRDFMRILARHLRRPLWPLPAAVTTPLLRLVLGEAADPLVLTGACVSPRRALDRGYRFAFPTLSEALQDLVPAARRT